MKDTKRRLELFSFYDHTGIAAHLERMAEQGWLLEKIGSFTWHYRRIEPKQVTFSVSYFPRASVFDPGPSEEQETFYDFCQHTGWMLAASSGQMQIFYNERPNPVPIDTDPVLAVDAIHRVAKKDFLRNRAIMMALMLMYGALMFYLLKRDPIRTLANGSLLWAGAGLLGLFVLEVMELGSYFFWYIRARRSARQGEFLSASGHSRLRWVVMAGSAAALLLGTLAGSTLESVTLGLRVVGIFAGAFLVYGVRELLKRRKEPAESNRMITLTVSVLLAFVIVGAATYLSVNGSRHNWFGDGCATYEHGGRTYVDHQDELPVTVEDLTDEANNGYTRERQVLNSLLLTRYEMRQWPRFDVEDYAEMAQLNYTIVEVKIPALYEFCRRAALSEPDASQSRYEPVDPAPWGGLEAYRWIFQYGREGSFLLFYPNRIVKFGFYPGNTWEPTPAQMAVVGRKLGG